MAKLKILLVDDEPDFVELIGIRVTEWGYDFLKAFNGRDAIEAVKRETPDIIVLDYVMPMMDGLTILKEIRKFDEKVPVIMFTNYPDMKTISDTKRLGISAFIPKLSAYPDVLSSLKATLEMVEKKLKKKEGAA